MKKKNATKQFPEVTTSEVEGMQKDQAVLLRLTKQDKDEIVSAASELHLTVTEFLTRAALIAASKVKK